jgi:hypothetical protein
MATITITPGNSFTATEAVTSTKLNDLGSPTAALTAASIGTADIADDAITTAKILDANVTKAKIENISAPLRVLGRTTAGAGVAEEVTINDDDDMANASAITLATDESIKAYVDGTSSFTTEDGQSAGYQVFPSGLKMAWGDSTAALNGTITFPAGVSFTVAPTIQISFNKAASAGTYNGSQVGDVTTTNFVYHGSYGNLYGPRYLAIGI